ncbi:MAG: hypothetical protein AAB972_02415, partial [Patescibacteria group bacterium]
MAGIIMLAVFFVAQEVYAGVLDDLKKSIEEKNAEIRKLEEDAQKYRLELSNKQQIGKTLKQELSRIQINIKKLQNDIGITQQQVKRAELQITELSYEISEREQSIKRIKKGLGSLLTLFYETERNSNIELFLRKPTFSEFFQILNTNASIEKKFLSTLTDLHILHTELEGRKNAEAIKRDESADLRNLLKQRQQALVVQKNEQNQVLTITQQQEKLYQQLLVEQDKKRQQLDQEIRDIEGKIRITIDQSSLPQRGSGVLDWPLPDVSKQSCFSNLIAVKNCITQF